VKVPARLKPGHYLDDPTMLRARTRTNVVHVAATARPHHLMAVCGLWCDEIVGYIGEPVTVCPECRRKARAEDGGNNARKESEKA